MFRIFVVLAILATAYGRVAIVPQVPMLDGRIVGGEITDISEAPWQVSIRYMGMHMCGGSILTETIILTAAHCKMSAVGSSIQYGVTKNNGRSNVISVKSYRAHPDYNGRTFVNDIAYILLKESIIFGSTAQPIPMATETPAVGSQALVSGWGSTSEGGMSPMSLRSVLVNIVSQEQCNNEYNPDYKIDDSMICAGVGGGKDACQGDSGGPLVVDGKLVGVVSWGYGCARPTHSGVYADVANLRWWVEAETGVFV